MGTSWNDEDDYPADTDTVFWVIIVLCFFAVGYLMFKVATSKYGV